MRKLRVPRLAIEKHDGPARLRCRGQGRSNRGDLARGQVEGKVQIEVQAAPADGWRVGDTAQ